MSKEIKLQLIKEGNFLFRCRDGKYQRLKERTRKLGMWQKL